MPVTIYMCANTADLAGVCCLPAKPSYSCLVVRRVERHTQTGRESRRNVSAKLQLVNWNWKWQAAEPSRARSPLRVFMKHTPMDRCADRTLAGHMECVEMVTSKKHTTCMPIAKYNENNTIRVGMMPYVTHIHPFSSFCGCKMLRERE